METFKKIFSAAFNTVERFFDSLKLRYKWRFDRWDGLRIAVYRGYGTRERLYLKGRVLDDEKIHEAITGRSRWANIRSTIQRIETDELPGARVQLRLQGHAYEAVTDHDGYFSFEIEPGTPLPDDRTWHEVSLTLLEPARHEVKEAGHILVPRPDVEFGIISDLDDTVVHTGATSKLRMARIVLLNNEDSRVPFEGVGAFYRALQHGPDRQGHNPVFYISNSPWNLYDLFEAFMEAHGIPVGPILLRDFGFDAKFFSAPGKDHKLQQAERLLATYPGLPFVLIGDSGQQDPEVYREIARRHPGRIRAVFIRDVSPPARDREVDAIAAELEAQGVPVVRAEETATAAEQAAAHGLIAQEAVAAVRADRRKEREEKKQPGLLKRLIG